MRVQETINQVFLNTDISFEEMPPTSAPFIKGLGWDIGFNPIGSIGTNNPYGYGQNELKKTPTLSNKIIPTILPGGYNKNIGWYYSKTTRELFYFNFNLNGNHGIYVISGDTGIWSKVIEDSQLLFTDNQENFIANHRVLLRFIKDKSGNVIEKYLLITEGSSWQKYINVIASIKTNGFDSIKYPYWDLKPPHFDRREILEWAVRPPMVKPSITNLVNESSDLGTINRFLDNGFQIAYAFQNTDGRQSTLSPYSLPILIQSQDFLNNPDSITKKVKVKMYAGSPMTEKVLIYIRTAKQNSNTLTSIQEWTDWGLYDTINKFSTSNSLDILGTDYWLRTNPFSGNNYDSTFNTIEYVLDLSKVPLLVNQEDANRTYTNMPQLSVAMTDLGDAALLCNNREGYPNFDDTIKKSFIAEVVEKEATGCAVPLRKITLYAYIGRSGDDFTYTSQVGFYIGENTEMVFGGMMLGENSNINIQFDEITTFDLNFADKNALRCYLKGTPYYADGIWCQVNSDNSIVPLPSLLDVSNLQIQQTMQDVLVSQSYYVCKFDIYAPAGKYIATLGRHNVASDGDYRNKSTYIYGIADSRLKEQAGANLNGTGTHIGTITAVKPNAIVSKNGVLYSKEMEIDCTSSDVDVWGNGADLFYVYCPHITKQDNKAYRFIEGYLREQPSQTGGGIAPPVEMMPYSLDGGLTYDCGKFTDKNGFYWSYTKAKKSSSADTLFNAKVNCQMKSFTVITANQGIGWRKNPDAYLSNYTGTGTIGVNNRIIYNGRITNIDGSLGYSNIGVSIKDGGTDYTDTNGNFTIIIHNGFTSYRTSNVYVNAGGNFLITISNCGNVPIYNFNEALSPCIQSPIPAGVERVYPSHLILSVSISTDSQTSLKENGKYSIEIHGADLAGREMYANVITDISVPSFLIRENQKATFFRLLLNNVDLSDYEDMKWLFVGVSKNISIKRYVQWVGDEISYIDNNGNEVTDSASAVYCSIKINSLYNANVANNFSLLSSYEFVKGDRIRILDDGDGNTLDASIFGDPIDLQILGTNYLQAAIDSGLLPPQSNTVLSTSETIKDVALIVKYDPRLSKLIDKNGFWIEIYTPTQLNDIIPFYEVSSFPIIKGKVAEFTGYNNAEPVYNYLSSIDLDFWDTYFFDRNITIPKVGDRFISHPFESPNVTDNWGANIISGGRNNIKNDNARQFWLPGGTIKSDDFLKEGVINGLATFREGNKKDFGSYPYGGILGAISQRNIIAFICRNDWFITDFNFHYAFVNEQGNIQANLNNGLSEPHQKVGSMFGIAPEDTGTLISYDKEIYWYDRKNSSFIRMNYRDAVDCTAKTETEQGGMESYIKAKTDFITSWNSRNVKENSFDIVCGIDEDKQKLYITFRNRRNNSNEDHSYINDRRNWQLNFQETIVYDIKNRGWLRTEGFTPEGYGAIAGGGTGQQLISFASGKPYYHNSQGNGFNEFYGVQTTPVIMGVFNSAKDVVKIHESISLIGNPSGWFVDYIYTDFVNSLSYLSSNQFKELYKIYYASFLRNMNSYPPVEASELFRSMLFDGYALRSKYLVFRLVGNYDSLNEYKELGSISCFVTQDDSNEKAEGK